MSKHLQRFNSLPFKMPHECLETLKMPIKSARSEKKKKNEQTIESYKT